MGKYGTLLIKPSSARLYRDVETFGKMDPYVLVKIGVEQGRSGVHKDAGKYPNWKDVRCEQSIALPTHGEDSCIIEVWDKNKHSKDKLIASTEFFLVEVFEKNELTKWIQLEYKGKKAAELNAEFKFLTHDEAPKLAKAAVMSIGAAGKFAYNPSPLTAAPPTVQSSGGYVPSAPPKQPNIMESQIYQNFASYKAPQAPAPVSAAAAPPVAPVYPPVPQPPVQHSSTIHTSSSVMGPPVASSATFHYSATSPMRPVAGAMQAAPPPPPSYGGYAPVSAGPPPPSYAPAPMYSVPQPPSGYAGMYGGPPAAPGYPGMGAAPPAPYPGAPSGGAYMPGQPPAYIPPPQPGAPYGMAPAPGYGQPGYYGQ